MLNNECSPNEVEELVKHLARKESVKAEELILQQLQQSVSQSEVREEIKKKLEIGLNKILDSKKPSDIIEAPVHQMSLRKKWYKTTVRYAAAIILVFLTGVAWYVVKDTFAPENQMQYEVSSRPVFPDFEPGSNKAILITKDGGTVYLDETTKGNTGFKGIAVIKPEEGTIEYDRFEEAGLQPLSSKEEISNNTIIIPRGGQYRIVLSDGTKVWLNAASSLKFPEVFKGNERVVELSGEGYFEVARDMDRRFKVKVNEVEVSVLGTHFNINSYSDNDEIKTTLLEGSVAISTNKKNLILKPGEQVSYKGDKLGKIISGVNLEQTIAWKNDHFDFTNESLQNISKQLSRWYKVEISIEEKLANKHISGIISRKNNISKVLEVLEISAGISSKIEGEKVFLYKK